MLACAQRTTVAARLRRCHGVAMTTIGTALLDNGIVHLRLRAEGPDGSIGDAFMTRTREEFEAKWKTDRPIVQDEEVFVLATE